jgi:hypothetical protein
MARETVTIRLTPRTNALVNIVLSKKKVEHPGKRITQDEVIWEVFQEAHPNEAKIVETAEQKQPGNE